MTLKDYKRYMKEIYRINIPDDEDCVSIEEIKITFKRVREYRR